MNHWKTPMLGELVEPASSWNPAKAASDKVFDYIDLSAVDQETKLIRGAQKLIGAEAPSRARQLVAKGDVLVSTVRPNLNGVARVPEELDGATASTGFCILRARPAVLDRSYLFHWVKSPAFVGDMVRKATGASYPAVSDRIIFESKLPLAPLAEQRRIAEVLDQAEALRAKRRAALAQLDTLTQSMFLDVFGDTAANSEGWPARALKDECDQINDCPHSTPAWTEEGVICLRTSNLTEGGWDWSDTRYVSEETYNERSKRGHVEPGDIVLSREGTVGIAAIVTPGMRVCMGQRLVQVRAASSVLLPDFLLRHLLYVLSPARIGQVMVGSTSQHLNVKELKALRLPLPPISLQRDFASRIAIVDQLKAAHRASLAEMEAMFAAFQFRAFRGRL